MTGMMCVLLSPALKYCFRLRFGIGTLCHARGHGFGSLCFAGVFVLGLVVNNSIPRQWQLAAVSGNSSALHSGCGACGQQIAQCETGGYQWPAWAGASDQRLLSGHFSGGTLGHTFGGQAEKIW
eukprot:CAMPEP_0174340380 /NCGR_PEP_ID=MMETSP0810-20121108/24631_1 /TAXON_ID=73025 ORGANISM="Eutreptiella gymnastica-like, Strain CCMP1594" /NCGR_SAMPLE_ID=MMETSP0810 /ASSEMBLY_ACC=CAM_ASM_000659 /LENGTH=123 /DNA_ID=CAMNT_0015461513 /DNA_START=806 /DNA_END=1174 /DNA_ORIENTATION=-